MRYVWPVSVPAGAGFGAFKPRLRDRQVQCTTLVVDSRRLLRRI
jgi:hypothetical protein